MNHASTVDMVLGIPTSVASCRSRTAARSQLLLAGVLLLSSLLGLLVLTSRANPAVLVLVFGLTMFVPLLWRKPVIGLYILLAGAITIETFRLHFPDSLTDNIPFFRGLGASGTMAGVDLNPAELLMLVVLAVWLLKVFTNRNLHFEKGPIFIPFTAYIVAVSVGAIYGIATGGDAPTALWEIRAQFYAYVCYLLAFNLLKNRQQAKIVMWILILGIGFKGLIGSWRYLVTLHGDTSIISTLTDYNAILDHGESYFFAMFIVLLGIHFLFKGPARQKWALLLLLVPLVIAFVASERRLGMITLGIGMGVALLFVFVVLREKRSLLIRLGILVCLLLPLYFVAFWSSDSLPAQPVRAVRSILDPGDRDYRSNEYRESESWNLMYNVRQNPIVGTGYGKEMPTPATLPDISQNYAWWNIMPHDTVLWVWMRLGTVGFILFWFFMGSIIVRGCLLVRNLDDRWLKGLATFAIISVIGVLLVSSAEMGLTDFRLMIYFGILVGLMFRLPGMDSESKQMVYEKTSSLGRK